MKLCPRHREEWLRWLDYRPARAVAVTSGAAYDDTSAGSVDRLRARSSAWRETIRYQQQLVRQACKGEASCAGETG